MAESTDSDGMVRRQRCIMGPEVRDGTLSLGPICRRVTSLLHCERGLATTRSLTAPLTTISAKGTARKKHRCLSRSPLLPY
jgi:hypothetical protein